MRRSVPAVLVAGLAALSAAGCGVGSGTSAGDTQLRVTRDFGQTPLVETDTPKTSGEDTIMRLLERNAEGVKTRYGGGFVQEIDGVAGGTRDGRQVDWFYYVNGYIADKGAAATKLRPGDRVWWDHHDWTLTDRIPAVVGSFPEPFVNGFDGNRHPIRIECGTDAALCKEVQSRFTDLGLVAAIGSVSRSFTKQTLRILVGPWENVGEDPFAGPIGDGPEASGVFARFSEDGKTLTTLDARGRVVQRLGAGTGLIAATAPEGTEEVQSGTVRKDPIWVVTGTDVRGVQAAVDALDEGALAGAFAVALVGGKPVRLPDAER